jgi:hypothetical protein
VRADRINRRAGTVDRVLHCDFDSKEALFHHNRQP